MKLYNALATPEAARNFLRFGARRLLVSFAYAGAVEGIIEEHRALGDASRLESLKLDSGAYTAWTKNKAVDLDAYAAWVHTIAAELPGIDVTAINLDVIPGTFGKTSTKQERAASMKQSIANADRLRALGVVPVEVFHQDEPWEFLDELLARRPDDGIVCISPRNDIATARKRDWFDAAYQRLLGDWPRVPRTHILGTTTGHLVQRYPAYSADSSQWSYFEQFGIRVHPRYRTHYFDEDRRAMRHVIGRLDNIAQTVDLIWKEEQELAKSWARRGLEFT